MPPITNSCGEPNFGTILADHAINTILADLISNASPVSNSGEPNIVSALEQIIQGSSVPTLSGNINIFKLIFDVLDIGGYLIDPSGATDFMLDSQTGSPYFASIDLPPMDGIADYDLRYEVGNVWSSFQLFQPGTEYFFLSGTDGIEFLPLDQFGNGVMLSGFLFDLSFASTGQFSGMLTEVQPVPEPTGMFLAGIAILAVCAKQLLASKIS